MQMMAELIFGNPYEANLAIDELTELGFELRTLDDWFDDYSPCVFVLAFAERELELDEPDPQSAFLMEINGLAEPFDGFVVEAGFAPADVEAGIASKS